ncbi:MAG: hypothetical protein ACO3EZ_17225 [Prochlorotrichaceae cyanobacterium]
MPLRTDADTASGTGINPHLKRHKSGRQGVAMIDVATMITPEVIIFASSRNHELYEPEIKSVFSNVSRLKSGHYSAPCPPDKAIELLGKLEDELLRKGTPFHGFILSDIDNYGFFVEIYDDYTE